MKLIATAIPDVVILELPRFGDDRGWFMETFSQPKFEAGLRELGLPLPRPFVQDNHSCSQRGVLRGLHYQLTPRSQGKLVRVSQGRVFDVAVDLRRHSPTFGQWVGAELSAANGRQLWIPEGFGHGFVALEDDTHFLYKTTDTYDKASERAVRWNDPAIGIDWPLEGIEPLLSPKDLEAPLLVQADVF
ncbi:MAG: dTDP-4-dehydrorhamnose 3,5-epimerase [Pseudomonadota bacterium]